MANTTWRLNIPACPFVAMKGKAGMVINAEDNLPLAMLKCFWDYAVLTLKRWIGKLKNRWPKFPVRFPVGNSEAEL